MRQFDDAAYWRERFGYGQRLYDTYLQHQLSASDTVFDFGCGDGAWLWTLRELTGCHIDGQEVSRPLADVVKRRLGIDIVFGPLEEIGQRIVEQYRATVKLAIVSGSLQHMISPSQCLGIIRNILRDDGYLYLDFCGNSLC